MVSGQALAQCALLKGPAGLLDGPQGDGLHHDVGGHDDAATHLPTAGVQQGDGASVRVPKQHGPFNAQDLQQRGQDLKGFVVHVVGQQASMPPSIRLARGAAHIGHGVGLAVTLARIHQARAAQMRAQACRPVAPHAHAAQTFVQKNQGRAIGTGGWRDAQGFKPDAVNVYFLKAWRMHLKS